MGKTYLAVSCSCALSAAWPSAQLFLGGGDGSRLVGALPFFLAGRGESGSRLPLLEGGAAAGVGDSRAAAHNTILTLIATIHSCAGLLVLQMWHEQASVLIFSLTTKQLD